MSCYPVLYFEKPLYALVLSGGESKRMGTDKGLIEINGETWAQKAYQLCVDLNLTTYVSINQLQKEVYLNIFSEQQLVVDIYDKLGPVGGLLSFHNQFPQADALVISCDMLDLKTDLMFKFLTNHELLSGFDAVVSQHEGFYQPFPGLFSAEMLSKINQLHLLTLLERYSFQNLFTMFSVNLLTLNDAENNQLKSYNTFIG